MIIVGGGQNGYVFDSSPINWFQCFDYPPSRSCTVVPRVEVLDLSVVTHNDGEEK